MTLVEVFANKNPQVLQADINKFLTEDRVERIQDIKYSTCVMEEDGHIWFSAMVIYFKKI